MPRTVRLVNAMHERAADSGHPNGWKLAVRVDRGGKLERAERTAAGGVRIPGAVVRAGVLTYQRVDGTTVRELVPPEEVGRAEALATLRDAPVTVGHPAPDATGSQLVSPATYRELSVGHVSGDPRADGDHAVASLVVLDATAIEKIDAGELVELSPGYRCHIDPTPGTWRGQPYDQVQRERTYNHVALLPEGGARGGATVALRVDGTSVDFAVQVGAQDETPMAERTDSMDKEERERIDGISLKVGSPEWREALSKKMARLDEEMAKLEDEKKDAEEKLEKSDADKDALAAERDTLKARLAEIEAQLAEQTSDEALDARADERAKLRGIARRVLGADAKLEHVDDKGAKRPMTAREIKVAVVAKLAPETDVSKLSDAYLAARFDMEAERLRDAPSAPLKEGLEKLFTPARTDARDGFVSPHAVGRKPPPSITNRHRRA